MADKTQAQIAADRAIELLGGPVAAARKLELESYQTVQSWAKNRVPAEYCPLIERATSGAIRCEEMRPDVAWDVLRMQAGEVDGSHPVATADDKAVA